MIFKVEILGLVYDLIIEHCRIDVVN